jgi:hypothetical protein
VFDLRVEPRQAVGDPYLGAVRQGKRETRETRCAIVFLLWSGLLSVPIGEDAGRWSERRSIDNVVGTASEGSPSLRKSVEW